VRLRQATGVDALPSAHRRVRSPISEFDPAVSLLLSSSSPLTLLLFANGDVWIHLHCRERDASIIGHVHHALRRYNADNPVSRPSSIIDRTKSYMSVLC
jgi:hypothetical protein